MWHLYNNRAVISIILLKILYLESCSGYLIIEIYKPLMEKLQKEN